MTETGVKSEIGTSQELLERIRIHEGLSSIEDAKEWETKALAEGSSLLEKLDLRRIFSSEMKTVLGVEQNANAYTVAKALDKTGWSIERTLIISNSLTKK